MPEKKLPAFAKKIDSIFRQKLRRKAHAEEVLEELVRHGRCSAKDLLARVRDRLPGDSFQAVQLERVLSWGEKQGLVFRNDGHCFATVLAEQYFEAKHGIDWVDKAVLSLSIIADTSFCISDEVATILASRMELSLPEAEYTISKLSTAPRRSASPRLARVLSRGSGKIVIAPTIFPHRDEKFHTKKEVRDSKDEDQLSKNAAELITCPRMDFAAEKNVLAALRSAGIDDIDARRVEFLSPRRYEADTMCSDCEEPNTLTDSVVSLSSPTVNPYTLNLLLRCESQVYFSDTVDEIRNDAAVTQKPHDGREDSSSHDYGLVARLVDPETRLTHFVVAGLYPPGTLGAAVYFRSKIEELLAEHGEKQFAVVVKSPRLVGDDWNDEYEFEAKPVSEDSFDVAPKAIRVDLRYQEIWGLLCEFAGIYGEYFRSRLDPSVFIELFDTTTTVVKVTTTTTVNNSEQVKEEKRPIVNRKLDKDLVFANRLLGGLQDSGNLQDAAVDIVFYFVSKSMRKNEIVKFAELIREDYSIAKPKLIELIKSSKIYRQINKDFPAIVAASETKVKDWFSRLVFSGDVSKVIESLYDAPASKTSSSQVKIGVVE